MGERSILTHSRRIWVNNCGRCERRWTHTVDRFHPHPQVLTAYAPHDRDVVMYSLPIAGERKSLIVVWAHGDTGESRQGQLLAAISGRGRQERGGYRYEKRVVNGTGMKENSMHLSER